MSMKYPYRDLGVPFDRKFRNDLNANFDDIEHDIRMIGGEAAQQALEAAHEAETQAIYAQTSGDYANDKGDYAAQQGDYAKTQGDYAKAQGDAASLAVNNANTAIENANTAIENANIAIENANIAIENANIAIENANNAAASANDAANDANVAADNANNAANNANTQATNAQNAAQAANDAAQAANQAADNANSAATNATNAANDANVAADNANLAAERANNEANYAKEQGDYAKEQGDYAKEQGDYAKEQGDYAKSQAELIDDILEQGPVVAVNGKTGNVMLTAEDVDAIPISEKGVAGGVARLNEEGKVVDANGNEVEGKVKTVNGIGPDESGNIEIETATSWNDLSDKPNSFPPSAHTHQISEVNGLQDALNDLMQLDNKVMSHLADIAINVRDFGAIGDGVADDSTPIQNAINHVESLGGGTVLLPNGTYLIKKSLLLPSNIHFKGSGKGTVIKGDFGSLVDPVLIGIKNCDTATGYDAAENITISDIAIDSPNTNGIGLAHAKNIKIYNIYGLSVYWHFVDISGCQNVVCDRLFLTGNATFAPFQFDNLTGDGGLKINDGTNEKNANVDGTVIDNAVLTNSIIKQTSTTNYGIHLHRSGGRNITIRDCTVIGSLHGIYQDESTQWENVVVDNVRFFNQAGRATWFRQRNIGPLKTNKNLKIINCYAEGFDYQGFVVDGWEYVIINNCTCNGAFTNNFGGSSPTNVSLFSSDKAIVNNLQIVGDIESPYGIRVSNIEAKNIIITNSIIKNADIGLYVGAEAKTIHAGLLFVDVNTPISLIGGGTIGSYPISTS